MNKPKLVDLLTKITYRMSCDDWGLTENEFDIIE